LPEDSPSVSEESDGSVYTNREVAAQSFKMIVAALNLPNVLSGQRGIGDGTRHSWCLGGRHQPTPSSSSTPEERQSKEHELEMPVKKVKPNVGTQTPTKSRVQQGDESFGLIRELDLQKMSARADKNLGRHISIMLLPYAGREDEVPTNALRLLSTLFLQAAEDARFGMLLAAKPLMPSPIFRFGLINATDATPNVIVVPCDESQIQQGQFKVIKAYYRLSRQQLEGKHSRGYLSNWLIAEWVQSFAHFVGQCTELGNLCHLLVLTHTVGSERFVAGFSA
jgi:hypothetical protein